VRFHPFEDLIATGDEGGTVHLWGVTQGHVIRELEARQRSINSVAFSADGKWLAAGSGGWYSKGAIQFWDVANGQEVRQFEYKEIVQCIPFAYFFGPKPDWALSGGKST
jgi:WD40 repeat protein